ncbi:glycosyltransferase family A protein [Rossellomorea marisflavi]|jgi:glycosyltransferase involved in cell wall biosynthesis|uniref:glycosyltransferase family A protein n=1 Tax=Rossellomorea marisflavi TaxID=189381 RepID=UPI003459A8D2
MRVEVLLSTMNQSDCSIIKRMNINSDVIVINQCEKFNYHEETYNKNKVKMFSFNEIGVGKSRNSALIRSEGDICLMADDDMRYTNNYKEIVITAFKENPKADVILFNVPINKENKRIIKVKKNQRIRFLNSLKFGTVNIAFRRDRIMKKNISFSLLFGGGARYGCGEDSLFIRECLKQKLKIFSNKEIIAEIDEGESSWFKGYNEKFFFDKGALFAALAPKISHFLAIQFVLRKRNLFKNSSTVSSALDQMFKGIREFKLKG